MLLPREYLDFEKKMDYLQEASQKFQSATTVPQREFWRSVVLGMRELCRERYEDQQCSKK